MQETKTTIKKRKRIPFVTLGLLFSVIICLQILLAGSSAELNTQVEINAPADQVWAELVNFQSYPDWNPYIRRASGEVKEGAQLELYVQPSSKEDGMTLVPTVLTAEPNRELRWLTHMYVPKLFDGEHMFIIEPIDATHVRLIQREIFKGSLVPFLKNKLNTDYMRGFIEMNEALKKRVEHR